MGVDHKRVLVTALVAAEPQVGQDYFLFCVRDGDFRDEDLLRAGAAFLGAGLARRGAAARGELGAGRGAFGAETRRTSGAGAR